VASAHAERRDREAGVDQEQEGSSQDVEGRGSDGVDQEQEGSSQDVEGRGSDGVLALVLAAAMFVLVVDTSLMNVSISAVVDDLDTTVSGVQAAIALEALVSAAFILISSKVGDLIGRKRAYVLGLLGYAVGAIAMMLAQDLRAIVVFWALVGGIGASLLLPAMQSLIHGNFEGAAQKRVYALVGASAAIAAAVGPLLGGFITTTMSWRVGFALEAVIIAIVLSQAGRVRDVAYTGRRGIDLVGATLSVLGMGGVVLGILVWQEGGGAVVALLAIGAIGLASFAWWLRRGRRRGAVTLLDPDLFRSPVFRLGITGQTLQQIALGGSMIALPIYFQMVLGYNAFLAGLSIAPLSLSMFFVAMAAGRKAADVRPATLIRIGFLLLCGGVVLLLPIVPRAESGWWFAIPLVIIGCGLGLLVSQLNNYTLAPIAEERISEAAGVNSAGGSFGLSFGLALGGGLMLAALAFAFTAMSDDSTVLPTDAKAQVSETLESDAQLMSDAQLQEQIAGEPPEVQDEILRINDDARNVALQVALLVPLLAGIGGVFTAMRMARQPELPSPASPDRDAA
jgi:MFS family permease